MVICSEYQVLERYHVNFERIHDKGVLTGQVSRFFETKNAKGEYIYETCCAQMSYAFNKAGPMIQNAGILPNDRVMKDNQGMEYLLSVPDMRLYFTRSYFPPEMYPGMGSARNLAQKIGGRKGVIAFGGRHIDLWNGSNFQYGGTGIYYENVLWLDTDNNNVPRVIYFWEIKSFVTVLEEEYNF
ncbi:T6SS effector amidase Tae4 family protein [Dyadobacter pollutisoli]|uniref:T6SS effector amidase Tae4 family protein n=1 Tax=Dyadobacter pollutisoli TaxID=2910158 RepID=A0A9E8SK14_9BACT|nr:T6SS effector amidase Tae4 family protein [Dyadobacter pollutisoli]WAC10754.1 T6SS effector amidase Tae4 family protein [Dyadobacter pollutisoli]